MKKITLLSLLIAMPATLFADWKSDADARIEKLRKGDFSIYVRHADSSAVEGATVDYRLKHHEFLFGTAIAHRPFSDDGEYGNVYRQFILDNFSGLVCENEMKWYYAEEFRGELNYGPGDALLRFAEDNDLKMRGHCLFWAKPKYNEDWMQALSNEELRDAMEGRLESAVTRYAGRLAAWDVNNEMLDGSFFRDKFGDEIAAWMFKEAARLDPDVELFVNEYGILGVPEKTERYIELIKSLQSEGAPVHGIGIQSHDSDRLTADPNAKAIDDGRSEGFLKEPLTPEAFLGTLDRFWSETKLPVHLTEISSRTPDADNRGETLDMLFRLGFSHESVEAILLWGFAEGAHWMGQDAVLMTSDG
jgi:GH35 family endo-1,4-beta-xylanase